MSRISDLVADSKLDAQFRKDSTSHVFHERDPVSGYRYIRQEHWRRERRTGTGGAASVWLEQCVQGKRDIELRAVKQFPKPARVEEYLRELECIAKFSHPRCAHSFVKSSGWYADEDELYITMEYLKHGGLHHYMVAQAPLSEVEVQQITLQICEALLVMHDNGFAHRDLKPGIADFGITKRVQDVTAGPSTKRGTEGFMPPEWHGLIAEAEDSLHKLAFAGDIWSVGEITSRIFTRQGTFKSLYGLYRFVEGHEPFPPTVLKGCNTSQDAIRFMQALMTPKPNLRLTAYQALQHGWFEPSSPSSPCPKTPLSLVSNNNSYEKSKHDKNAENDFHDSNRKLTKADTFERIKPERIKEHAFQFIDPDPVKGGNFKCTNPGPTQERDVQYANTNSTEDGSRTERALEPTPLVSKQNSVEQDGRSILGESPEIPGTETVSVAVPLRSNEPPYVNSSNVTDPRSSRPNQPEDAQQPGSNEMKSFRSKLLNINPDLCTISSDGVFLVTASRGWGASMEVWDLLTGHLSQMKGTEGNIAQDDVAFIDLIKFSPVGNHFMASLQYQRVTVIEVWNAATKTRQHGFRWNSPTNFQKVEFSSDGSRLAFHSQWGLQV
ncbi:kinase-like protein [Lojkania enalia]|uniref:Autophagy-related protein 1 n=1 Tax=Lojkania enalia TaxID=147567 RepID=A0A9P4KHF2_9PLEO|nr:kinase-like protein [Didymosphaeria enalia]